MSACFVLDSIHCALYGLSHVISQHTMRCIFYYLDSTEKKKQRWGHLPKWKDGAWTIYSQCDTKANVLQSLPSSFPYLKVSLVVTLIHEKRISSLNVQHKIPHFQWPRLVSLRKKLYISPIILTGILNALLWKCGGNSIYF